jgi:two-component system, NtrC family, response regulator AtoC
MLAKHIRNNETGTGTAAKAAPMVLLVEDETLFASAVKRRLEQAGYRCTMTTSLAEASRELTATADLVLLDLRLPDGNGLELLERLNAVAGARQPPVIVLTAFAEIGDAVRAMKLGAADYLKKPIDLDELLIAIEKVLNQDALRHRLDYSRQRDSHAVEGTLLLGQSAAIEQTRRQLERLAGIAGTDGEPLPTVLITGETGTGKDIAARLLHLSGSNRSSPFVHVDCAALPRELMESELFGHERGAFTGAQQSRAGLIEAAEDGSVFLDEIGELPLELQAKLLAVIERRRIRRLGALRETLVEARFIAATNRNIEAMIAEGRFRPDLYYRINVVTIVMPTLRERAEDIVLLAEHFLENTCRRYGLPRPTLRQSAQDAMRNYPWPGNVRELKHLVERAVLLAHGQEIGAETLALPSDARAVPDPNSVPNMTLDESEKNLIAAALQTCGGNVSKAARRLGVSRMTLRYRMEKYGLQ